MTKYPKPEVVVRSKILDGAVWINSDDLISLLINDSKLTNIDSVKLYTKDLMFRIYQYEKTLK